jgi:hypothetical protein
MPRKKVLRKLFSIIPPFLKKGIQAQILLISAREFNLFKGIPVHPIPPRLNVQHSKTEARRSIARSCLSDSGQPGTWASHRPLAGYILNTQKVRRAIARGMQTPLSARFYFPNDLFD